MSSEPRDTLHTRGLHRDQQCGWSHCSNRERKIGFLQTAQLTWATPTPGIYRNVEGAVYKPKCSGAEYKSKCTQSGLVGKAEDREAYIEETEAGKLCKGVLVESRVL